MYKSLIMSRAPIYKEERFRTPLAQERELGLWADRIGWLQEDARKPSRFRDLGQYAAIAVEAGEGILEALAQGRHAIHSGDVILLRPKMATRYYPGKNWATRWVVWNGPEAEALDRLSGLGQEVLVVRGGAAAVLKAWHRLNPLMDRQDFDAFMGRKLALLELVRELSALCRMDGAIGDTRFLGAALRELTGNEGAPESVSAIAKRLHVSPSHFRRLFKTHTGASPKGYQVSQRITRAKELLAAGRSIKETAEALGFSDVFHFMRLFRRITGQTAGQFAAVFGKTPTRNL